MTNRLSAPVLAALVAMLLAVLAIGSPRSAPQSAAAGFSTWVDAAATHGQASLASTQLPAQLRGKLGEPRFATANSSEWQWASLPETLDGRVYLRAPNRPARAGWSMLDVPAAERIPYVHGALYTTDQYDVIHRVEAQRLREFILVRERQGVKVWRWKLHGNTAAQRFAVDANGRIDLGGGFRIEPPVLQQVDGQKLPVNVRWQVRGDVLELRVDDRSLPLPYVIDPDATAPLLTFDSWTESSPYAYINTGVNADAIWVNTNQADSATVRFIAVDNDTGVKHVTFPSLGAGWSPASGNETGSNTQGLLSQYWDNRDKTNHPGTNFTGASGLMLDSNFDIGRNAWVPPGSGDAEKSSAHTGELYLPENGTYYFQVSTNDGGRLVVDGTEVWRAWVTHGGGAAGTNSTQCNGGMVVSGAPKWVSVRYENFTDAGSGFAIHPRWRLPSQAGSYGTPTGCDTAPAWSDNRSTGWSGAPTTFPLIPAANFRTTVYERTYSWTASAADPGIVQATATNNEDNGPEDTSSGVDFEVIADPNPPTGGSLVMNFQGWNNQDVVNVTVNNPTDALSGIASRVLERRQGASDGAGGCTLSGGWTTWQTPGTNPSYNYNHNLTNGDCWEYRYVVTDNVGNQVIYQDTTGGPAWFGEDRTVPTITANGWTEGTNPQYQYVASTTVIYINGNQSGDATYRVNASDTMSGVQKVNFPVPNPSANWTGGGDDTGSPYEMLFSWTSVPGNADAETATVTDYAGRTATLGYNIRRDTGLPDGPSINPSHTNGRILVNSLWIDHANVNDVNGGGEANNSGVDNTTFDGYRLYRMEVPYDNGNDTCDGGGPPTTWDPMQPGAVILLASGFTSAGSGYQDTTVQNGKCYRYFSDVTDRVGNTSVIDQSGSVTRVDSQAPTGTISSATPIPSGYATGTINGWTGTLVDAESGPRRVTVRYRQVAAPNTSANICTNLGAAAGTWTCNTNWNTTLVPDGLYDVIVDCEDQGGNIQTACATRQITVDNSQPTTTFASYSGLTGNAYWSGSGNTMYYRPGTPGTVTVEMTGTDAHSGIANIGFPTLPAGWSPASGNDATSPYTYTYSFIAAPTAPGTQYAFATNNAGLTSSGANRGAFTINADSAAPFGGTSAVAPSGWTTDTSPTLTYSGWSDAGADIANYQWERQVGTATGFACGGWSAWTPHSGPVASPWDDGTPALVDNNCYQYRLVVTDNVTNAATTAATSTVMVDTTPATGTIDAAPADPWAGNIAITGTSADAGSRWAEFFTLRWEQGGPSTNICTSAATGGSGNWSCNWNTAGVPDGTYTLHLDLVDHAGNVTTDADTRTVVVDNTGPSITFVDFVAGTSPANQYVNPGTPDTIFVKTNNGAGGSFTVRFDASDPSGVANVGFPDLDGGAALWTPGAGTDTTASPHYEYTYTWANNASDPGPQDVTAADVPGATSTLTGGFTVVQDIDAPQGGNIDYPGGYMASVPLSYDPGLDALTSTKTWQIERREATLTAGTCGGFGPWGPWGAPDLSSPQSDATVAVGNCYQYRLTAEDQVGNSVTYTDPEGDTVMVDVAGIIVTQSGGSTDVSEAGGTDTYTIQLNAPPTNDVTIDLGPNAQVGASPDPLVFTTANWNTPQVVTVSAVDDAIAEGAHTGVLTHTVTSLDPAYDGYAVATINPNIADNDTAGIDSVESGGSTMLTEGGAGDTWDYRLTSEPTANVTFIFTLDSQGSSSPASLTFTPANWNIYQTVTFSAVDDAVAEGPHVTAGTLELDSADPNYDTGGPLPPSNLSITDNDTASITITESGGDTNVTEGGASDSFDVVLTSQPTANVTINFGGNGQVNTSGPSVTFTPLNWMTPQTVTVTAVDDDIDELDPHLGTVTFSVVSGDAMYNVLTPSTVNVDVTDDDTAGITLTESGGSSSLTEGGATDTYSLVLTSEPIGNVVINIGTDADGSAAPNPVTFTPGNWSTPQNVTMTAVDDFLAEGAHSTTYTNTVTAGSDPNYDGFVLANVVASITDNDNAGITVTESSGDTVVEEGGATDSFDVVLTSQPTADVTVTLDTSDGQTTTVASVVFTALNWNTPQTVVVTAVDDPTDETDPHAAVVGTTASSLDGDYNAIAVADVNVQVIDNDFAGLVGAESGGSTDLVEGGAADDATVWLNSQPSADVTVTLVSDAQAIDAPTVLTFTTVNWNVPQTVNATAVDDDVYEGPHMSTSVVTTSSADPQYNLGPFPWVRNVQDNDTVGITVTETAGSTDIAEGGATDTFDVVLTSEPTADVVIDLTNDADATASPVQLTFTAANWDTPQTVTVTAVDDAIAEGPHTSDVSFTVSSADGYYDAFAVSDVTANVTDNDTADILITESGGSTDVTEGGATDSVDVVLTSEPTANVSVSMVTNGQLILSPTPLTFTPGNWNVPQTVSVTAVDDMVAEGAHTGPISASAVSGDSGYNGLATTPFDANIADNDAVGITIIESGGSSDIAEGGATDSYTVQLDTLPSANVTVTIAGDVDGTPAPTPLTFTPANWNVPQPVTLTAVDDAIVEGAHTATFTHTVASLDLAYDGLVVGNVVANITDNDFPGVLVTPSGGSVDIAEAGLTDTFDVVLGSEPTADVTVTLTITDGQTTTNVPTLTFTSANWMTPQTVTVTAVDDPDDEASPHAGLIETVVSSADLVYDGITADDVTPQITDNDTAGITVTPSAGSTNVAEAGPTSDDFDVVLDTRPSQDVTITFGTGDGQTTTDVPSVTFTSANWNVPQTVNVTAVDDSVDEADPHPGAVTMSVGSLDANYSALTPADVAVSIADNDTVGITVTESGGSTAVAEAGPTSDTVDVVLDSQPTADVTITLTPDAQVTVAPLSLTFTSANWNVPQTMTITAVDDLVDEADPHTGAVSFTVSSADLGYDGFAVVDVSANVSDNDTAGVTVTPTLGSTVVVENGATDSYDVVLDSQPLADVTINLSPDAQITTGVPSLTFTSANWNVPQSVTVTAVDDEIDESDPHPGIITHSSLSLDLNYLGLVIADTNVDVSDDDVAGITITESAGTTLLSEAGTTDTYDVVLDSQPTADVTITLTPDAQVTTSGVPALTFTNATWNVPQTVTMTAVDDLVAESDPHPGTASHTSASADPNYAGNAISDVVASIADNDFPDVIVTESGGSNDVVEGGASDSIDIVLGSMPTADVTIGFTAADGQTTIVPSIVFTNANWNVPQTVAIDAFDDAIDEADPHTGVIAISVTSADLGYDGFTVADRNVNIGDNDTAGITVTESGGSTAVDETGPTGDTFDVVLDSEPTADVTVTLGTADGQTTTDVPSLTFTSANWNVPQTVTVTAVDDAIDESDPHPGDVTFSVASADPLYSAITPADVTAQITDNDTVGVTITESGGSTAVDETGPTGDDFDIVLDSQPVADVTITFGTGDGQTTTSVPSVTFTSANWNVPQNVVITAVDDPVDEANPHTGTISFALASADAAYAALTPTDITAQIADNDTADVLITESGLGTAATEGGLGDDYTVVLTTQPAADVTITISPDLQVTTGSGTLTFTSANWATPQTVTLSAVDDLIDEADPHPGLISHSSASADANYAGLVIADVTAQITDNDTAGITITPTTVNVEEGGASDTYDVVLDTQPTSDVTINLNPDAQIDTNGVPSLTFTSVNWNVPQTVTVNAIDDLVSEANPHPGLIAHTVGSLDPFYSALTPADVVPSVVDNDIPGITVTPSGTNDVDETGPASDTLDVVLDTQPTDDVIITLVTADGQLSTVPSITFTTANWNVPQTVNVAAVDDAVDEADPHTGTLGFTVASTDLIYDAFTVADETFSIADNDTAGITLTESGGSTLLDETGPTTDDFDVVLDSQPAADVTLTFTTSDGQTTTSVPSVTFTSANWNVPQNVVVTAVDDLVDEADPHPGVIATAVGSVDPLYAPLTVSDVTAQITDNDTAGITVTPTAASNDVVEGGAGDSFDVVLLSQPTADVTITLTPDAQVVTGAPNVTFTSANWNVPQTVTVDAVDDFVAELSPHAGAVSFAVASGDAIYAAIAVPDEAVQVTDNDVAGVVITESAGSTDVIEGGAGDTYDVVLATQPTGDVTITLTPDAQVATGVPSLTFTSANWNVPQTVTVDAVDDLVDELDPHPGLVAHVVSSADLMYDAIPVADINVNVTDNDTAGVTITQSGGSTDIAEGGATDTYDVVLDTEPTADVTITLTPDAQVTTSGVPSLTFTAANWNVPQGVTVEAVDDLVVEADPHPGTVVHTAASLDANYNGAPISDVVAQITENDIPDIFVTPTAGSNDVVEGGANDTFDVVLGSMPTADVTITLTGTQVTTTPAILTFTAGNWNVPQTVTVDAIDDAIDEADPHGGSVSFVVTSPDLVYDGWTILDQAVSVGDNDTAGYSISPAGGSADVAEGGPGDTFDVVLLSEPTADVTVNFSADAQVTTGAASATFTSANWNVPQTINIDAVDDLVAEGLHNGTVSFVASSADAVYDTMTQPNMTVAITDNDMAGVIVDNGGSLDVTEGGAGDTMLVRLTSMPTADVTITFSAFGGELLTTPVSATFTAGNWNVDQMITIDAVDDAIAEGPHSDTVNFAVSSVDAMYDMLPVGPELVNIADNDTAGITKTEIGGSTDVTEGGATDTYEFVLTSEPTADVTITLTDDAQVDAAPALLTFTSANWNVPQVVTVTAVDDSIDELDPHPGVISHVVGSADVNYAAVTISDVTANVSDNDTAGVTITESGASTDLEEGGATDTYDVVLDTEPTADVTVTLTPDAQVTGSSPDLTFTSANWNVPQTVTLTAVDDFVIEASPHPGVMSHSTTSVDPFYNGLTPAAVTGQIIDNDTPGVTVLPSAGTTEVTEGGASDSFDIVLESMPSADVTITFGGSQTSTTVPDVTFTAANWNVPQTVTVEAVDDAVDEADPHPGTVSFTVGSVDLNYNGFVVTDLSVDVFDNDTAGITVTQTGGTTDVDETLPFTDTYDVVLDSEPTADVTITLATPDGQTTVSPATLTFTSADWNTPQTVTVEAVDDPVDEATPHTGTITHTVGSADANYGPLTIADITASITDNDTAAVLLTHVGGSTDVTEGGASDTVEVVLATQPTADVTVTVAAGPQLTLTGAALTFTSANWNTPQTVTVDALDDVTVEGPHTETLDASAASADSAYDTLTAPALTANITDNDTPGFSVTESGGSTDVGEDGTTDTVDVVLTAQPLVDVTITLTPDAQVSASPAMLTFTNANWNVPQSVTIGAIDDPVIEGVHTGNVAYATASADAAWVGLVQPALVANISDNDIADVVLTESSGSTDVAEGGAGDTYDVTLAAQPAADVTVTLAPDAQVTASPSPLTFTSANWNVPQTVTVGAVDDFVAEGTPHAGSVNHTLSSADANFDTLTKALNVNVTDNETAGIILVETGGSTDALEGGAGDTYLVQLASEPTAPVTVNLATPDGQTTPTPASVVLDATDWNVGEAITIDAVDDAVAEGNHTGVVQHAATSGDANYNLTGPDLTVNITDNDTAGVLVTESGPDTAVAEGGLGDDYTVVLTSEPTADVTIALTPDAQVATGGPSVTFTSANWNVPQTVTVSAVDDGIAELTPHAGLITHTASSADTNYDGGAVTIADVNVAITDNDVAGITVVESGGATSLDEAGPTSDDYTIVLDSQPAADVTINLASDIQSTLSAPSITFTAANWNVPQTVTVTAVDDPLIEGAHTSIISHTITSLDPVYGAFAPPADITASVADNDVAGITITQTAGSNEVTEGGADDTVDIVLNAQPLVDVTIDLTGDSQVNTAPASLTFTPGAWNVPQTVTLSAVNDAVAEGPHTGTVGVDVNGDANFDPLTDSIPVNVIDDDIAGVLVSPGTVTTTEGVAGQSVDVSLQAEPAADVTLTLTPDAQSQVDGAAAPVVLTFTSANWSTPQTVVVGALDDLVAEASPHAGSVAVTTASTSTPYDAIAVTPISLDITDNDTPGVLITPTGADTAVVENTPPSPDTYDVCLTSQPTADVTVTIADPGSQVTVSAALVFTPAAWDCTTGVQTVTVTPIDDNIDETDPHTTALTHVVTSTDPNYDGLVVGNEVVSIGDNDTAAVSATLGATSIAEGQTTTWTFTTASEPTAPITINLTDDTQLDVDQNVVTLDASTYPAGVTVTITAVQDGFDEADPHPGSVTLGAATADPNYAALLGTLTDANLQITDDDTAGATVTPTSVDISEDGTTATVDVALSSEPLGNVTVNIAGDTNTNATPTSLTFTPSDYATAQTVTISAVDDGIAEGPHTGTVTLDFASPADAVYDATSNATVNANITDNDTATVIVDQSAGATAVKEGVAQKDNVSVRLGSQPLQPVTISVGVDSQITADVTSMTFTPANYSTPQEVKIGAVDDKFAETTPHSGNLAFTISTTDVGFSSVTVPPVAVSIDDNDKAGVKITETDAKTSISEAGATDSYTVVLTSQPIADVALATDAGGQASTNPPSIAFTTANWNVPQTVTVSAVDDLVDEDDPHSATLSHTGASLDPAYTGALAQLPVSIADNDVSGVEVDAGDGLAVTEGAKDGAGASDTYTVRLTTKPKAGLVVVRMVPDDEVTAEAKELSFTVDNYDTAQTVTVKAVDDEDVEGDHAGRIEMTVTAAEDPAFNAKTLAGLDVAVTDNDKDPTIGPEDEEDDTKKDEKKQPTTSTDKKDDKADTGSTGGRGGKSGPGASTSLLPSGDGNKKKGDTAKKKKQTPTTPVSGGADAEKADKEKKKDKSAKGIFDNLSKVFQGGLGKIMMALGPLLLLLTIMALLSRDPTKKAAAAGGSSAAAEGGRKMAGGKRRKDNTSGGGKRSKPTKSKGAKRKMPKGKKPPRGGGKQGSDGDS